MAKIHEILGRFFPRGQLKRLGFLLEAAGMHTPPEGFAGILVLLSAVVSAVLYMVFVSLEPLRALLFRLSLFVSSDATVSSLGFFTLLSASFCIAASLSAVGLVSYVALLLKADSRRRKVEEVLPDFLSLAAANVRAGMTIDQAMWYAAKPEFGLLSQEVSIVAKKAFGGVPFNTAIDYLTERFDSKSVKRGVSLIKQGIASGGKLADILERTAEDSRQMQIMRKEIAASLLMYVLFIVFAAAIGTPFLFAISAKLIGILENVISRLPDSDITATPGGVQTPIALSSKPSISSSDFFIFTMLSSLTTAVLSSLIIGTISKGRKSDGVPYIPFLVAATLLVFFVVSAALGGLLSSIYI